MFGTDLREIFDAVDEAVAELGPELGEVAQGENADDLRLYDAEIVRGELGADDGQADLGVARTHQQAQPDADGSRLREPILRLHTRV